MNDPDPFTPEQLAEFARQSKRTAFLHQETEEEWTKRFLRERWLPPQDPQKMKELGRRDEASGHQ